MYNGHDRYTYMCCSVVNLIDVIHMYQVTVLLKHLR